MWSDANEDFNMVNPASSVIITCLGVNQPIACRCYLSSVEISCYGLMQVWMFCLSSFLFIDLYKAKVIMPDYQDIRSPDQIGHIDGKSQFFLQTKEVDTLRMSQATCSSSKYDLVRPTGMPVSMSQNAI